MADTLRQLPTVLVFLVLVVDVLANRDRVYMIRSPDSVAMPLNDETTLTCEMNLKPDNFTWRHYPLLNASDPSAPINFGSAPFAELPFKMDSQHEKYISQLEIKFMNEKQAGDYQCLAQYGASVVASVPGRITKSTLERFPKQDNTVITVTAGNTVIWWCELPFANPPAYIDYYKDGSYVTPKHSLQRITQSLVIPNVTEHDTGIYKCRVGNALLSRHESSAMLNLKVVSRADREKPRFIRTPKRAYTVIKGHATFLECPIVGNPVPRVTWTKRNGELPSSRSEMIYGGLKIVNVTSTDDGVYECAYQNFLGVLSHKITLSYNEAPSIIEGPENSDVKEGDFLDLECTVRGTPEPLVSWLLNGNSVLNDSSIEAVGNQIYFRPVEKRHAGILQCFASNIIQTVYSSANLEVIPKQISSADAEEHSVVPTAAATKTENRKKHNRKHKGNGKGGTAQMMIPPTKPNISRLNDEAVVVRWSVPPNKGLPIQFFKVQYRELGPANPNESYARGKGSRWKTIEADIPPHIYSYEVAGLKPDYYYKFRIAAVYSNNDNKISPHSARFLLNRQDFFLRNPLPVPTLTHTEAVDPTSIRIFWEYEQVPNVTLDGFYVNYMLSDSAGDFTKATVEGEQTRSYVITHLQPDTMYDIKVQSFTTNSASHFSHILKRKTLKAVVEIPAKNPPKQENNLDESPNMYVFIAAGVIALALVGSVVVLLIICRKWKQKKNTDSKRNGDQDKSTVEDGGHHIQADSNDYIVRPPKSRSNGCIPPNRMNMNITSNPLADADNKNQNMIEMSCLSSQNNNCSSTQPSVSTSESSAPGGGTDLAKKNKTKNRDKSKRNKLANSDSVPGENYV